MRSLRTMALLGAGLALLSALTYLVQIRLFNAPRDTFFYLLQDLAFVPIQVLLVTLIIDRLLSVREKKSMLEKMNMPIGLFFSEMGTHLIKTLSARSSGDGLAKELADMGEWTESSFKDALKRAKRTEFRVNVEREDIEGIKAFLMERKDFLLSLLQNPNLLEHDTFTELLRSVFHVYDELASRHGLSDLAAPDLRHIENDLKRAYSLLVYEWIAYMRYLKKDYPYLFSIAARKNPFDGGASVEIRE